MAADFDQVRIPDLDLPDIKVEITREGEKTDKSAGNVLSHQLGESTHCGEPVKPGVGPGVLIGTTRVWRNGRETITDVDRVFPAGAASVMCPAFLPDAAPLSWSARLWTAASSVTMLVIGSGAKFLLSGLNTTVVHGRENLDAVLSPNDGCTRPLLSVINHHSCFDDPGIWGAILSASQLMDTRRMRWGASASEVIFTSRPLETFWKLGKVIPIVRGWGVDQPAMRFLQDKLDRGGWVNIFPEGKVTVSDTIKPLRWGVGRLIWECVSSPTILPVVHCGMDSVLPNPTSDDETQPCVLRPGNLVTVNIGRPLDVSGLLAELRLKRVEAAEARLLLTEHVREVMESLYQETRDLHRRNIIRWLDRWTDRVDVTPSLMT